MPPDIAERRPRAESGAQDGHGGGVGNMLQRMRAAARRLPPLAPGHSDPLDALASLLVRPRPCYCPGEFGPDGQWRPHCRGAA